MKKFNSLLSFLDLLTCSLGSVILLAVIFSLVKNPLISPVFSKFIMGQIVVEGEGQLGLHISSPDDRDFTLFEKRKSKVSLPKDVAESMDLIYSYPVKNGYNLQREYFVVIKKPRKGRWTFRPYYVDINDNNRFTQLNVMKARFWTISDKYELKNSIQKIGLAKPFYFALERFSGKTYEIDINVR